MSGFTLKLRAAPDRRLDLSSLSPQALAGSSADAVQRLPLGEGRDALQAGDAFAVSGTSGETLVIEGGSDRLDFVGAGLTDGTLRVEGDVGLYAGWRMSGGELRVAGNAGPFLASAMSGGLVVLDGDADENAGSPRPGDRYGMTGGTVVVRKNAGARAGDRMRRGTIVVKGRCGAFAASRMMGGTIWVEGGFGETPGVMMRRGTLIGPSVERFAATYADCGDQDLLALKIMSGYFREKLGALAPPSSTGRVRKFAGDLAALGKGEILLTR